MYECMEREKFTGNAFPILQYVNPWEKELSWQFKDMDSARKFQNSQLHV